MGSQSQLLENHPVFSGLPSDERAELAELCVSEDLERGHVVYQAGETGDSLYLIERGAIDLNSDAETTYITLKAGEIFGLLSLIDAGAQPTAAVAAEPSRLLRLERSRLEKFIDAHPPSGIALLRSLSEVLAAQVRTLIDSFRQMESWNLDLARSADLPLDQMLFRQPQLTVELVSGESATGRLVKAESWSEEHVLSLRSDDGKLHLIPYRAIARIIVPQGDRSTDDAHSEI